MIQLFQHHARYNASKYLKEYDDFSLNLVLILKQARKMYLKIIIFCFFSGLTTKDYETLIWTTLAEFPGVVLALCLIDPIGRRNTLKTLFGMFTTSTFLMLGCSISKSYLLLMLFIARGTMAGVFQVVYLYTPEVYPTNLRAVAYGKSILLYFL